MPVEWSDLDRIQAEDFTLRSVPDLLRQADPWGDMEAHAADLRPALDQWDRDVESGEPELPYPPDFPKMPGEPSRVQPSRRASERGRELAPP